MILTVCDPDRWYESALNTIYGMRKFASSPIFSLVGVVVPDMRHRRRAAQMVNELAWEGVFGGKFEDRQYAIGVFSRLNEEVKEGVPAERLLVYEVKEGWEPLCEFLGVEVPKGRSFPHLNDTDTFLARTRRCRALTVATAIGGVSLAVLGLLYLLSATSRRASAKA